jgi:hypothetical protein
MSTAFNSAKPADFITGYPLVVDATGSGKRIRQENAGTAPERPNAASDVTGGRELVFEMDFSPVAKRQRYIAGHSPGIVSIGTLNSDVTSSTDRSLTTTPPPSSNPWWRRKRCSMDPLPHNDETMSSCFVCQKAYHVQTIPKLKSNMPTNSLLQYFSPKRSNRRSTNTHFVSKIVVQLQQEEERSDLCTFCERKNCPDCLLQCQACDDRYCRLCLTTDYSGGIEHIVCPDCVAMQAKENTDMDAMDIA